jgi:hypothetical protein
MEMEKKRSGSPSNTGTLNKKGDTIAAAEKD